MTSHILCEMMDLYFEDDRPLALNLIFLPNNAVVLDRSPASARYKHTGWDTCPALLAPPALKVLLNTTQKVICVKHVGHLQSAGRSSYIAPGRSSSVGHVRNPRCVPELI